MRRRLGLVRRHGRASRATAAGTPVVELGTVRRRRIRIRRPRLGARTAGLILSLVLSLGAAGSALFTLHLHSQSDLLAAAPIGPATHAVIFVVDGARPSDFSLVPTPHISDLAGRGITYSSAWAGQLENVGPASNATIATGLFPGRDGMVGLEWQDPHSGQIQRPVELQSGQLSPLDRALQAQSTTSLASMIKQRYARARVLSVAGNCATADAAGGWSANYVLCPIRQGSLWTAGTVAGHRLPAGSVQGSSLSVPVARGRSGAPAIEGWLLGQQDNWLTTYALRVMRRTHPQVTVVNFPEIAALEPYLAPGARDAAVARLVRGIDAEIGRFVAELRRETVANQTVFVVTSDQAVTQVTTRLPASSLERAVTAAGGQLIYADPGEASFVGLEDVLQSQPVAQAFQDEHLRNIDAIYYKVRTGSSWSYEPQYLDPDLTAELAAALSAELRTMVSGVSADVVIMSSPATGLIGGRKGNQTGTGLGAQWDTQHIPLIIAGHGVVPDVRSQYPARLADIAPTIEALMWQTPSHVDGTILADAMAQPPSGADSAQAAKARSTAPMVRALKARPSLNVG